MQQYSPKTSVKGVIFDFDGVIVDTLSLHLQAWERAYSSILGKPIGDYAKIIGHATEEVARNLANESLKPEIAPSLVKLKRTEYYGVQQKVRLFPGVHEIFLLLKKGSIPFGIASNSRQAFICSALSSHHIEVPIVVGIDNVKNPKPDPEPFILCARLMNISPKDFRSILVFEDSFHGVQAASKAGMTPIGITSALSNSDLMKAGAKTTYSCLLEAVECHFLDSSF